MKITIGNLKALIHEAMITSLNQGMKVIIQHEGREISIRIREEGKPKAHDPGFIILQKIQVSDGIIWEVVNSGARSGYGPLLYDISMEYVSGRLGDLGITPDTSMVSGEAQRIWDFYLKNRKDVESEPLPRERFPHASDRPEPLRYYYYKLDTPTLDSLERNDLIAYN